MRVIAKKILREFWEKHSDCEQQLKSWYQEASNAAWKSPNEIKLEYPSASILSNNRIGFNIKGNSYRLIIRLFGFDLSELTRNTTELMQIKFKSHGNKTDKNRKRLRKIS